MFQCSLLNHAEFDFLWLFIHLSLQISYILHLVLRVHVPFGQYQGTELWNNQFPETRIFGLPVSRRMRGLVYMASRDKVDADTFDKGIQYALEKLSRNLALKEHRRRTAVSNFKSKRHECSGNELVNFSRAPPGGGGSHMNLTGMLVGNFEFNS